MIVRVCLALDCVWVILRVFCAISNLIGNFEGVLGGF